MLIVFALEICGCFRHFFSKAIHIKKCDTGAEADVASLAPESQCYHRPQSPQQIDFEASKPRSSPLDVKLIVHAARH